MNSYRIRILIFSAMLVVSFSYLDAQDTNWVYTINFDSNTRDSLIEFPSEDHNQYEKILMYYTMRCKDGLVSTTSDRNRGCGEWDYLCNTFIVDSTYIDSLKASHPNYIIEGHSENFFLYRTQPTYNYYEYKLDDITINSQSNVNYLACGAHIGDKIISPIDAPSNKSYFLYTESELSGLTSIKGIQMDANDSGKLRFLRIRIASTTENSVTPAKVKNADFEQVFIRDFTFLNGKNDLVFHKTFSWTGGKNLLFEVSYTADADQIGNLTFKGSMVSEDAALTTTNSDLFIDLKDQGPAELPVISMEDIKNEISVSFWAKGNANVLPNNNSIFYAIDSSGNRQLNVHMPWSNSRIYWDCGGDAAGYDRIDKASTPSEFEENWNHWVFTKNTTTGNMKIYLNGAIWHAGSGKKRPININRFVLGSNIDNTIPYSGFIDDFAVWDKELTVAEILSIMHNDASTVVALHDNLRAYYDFNESNGTTIRDRSKYQLSGGFSKEPSRGRFRGFDLFKEFVNVDIRPDISLIIGTFDITINKIAIRDSFLNQPVKIRPFSVENGSLIEGTSVFYWTAGWFPVFDEYGNIIEEIEFLEEDELTIETLYYHSKRPGKFELLSFITPYGINLDFGLGGKTWVFDVTDFGPILKNRKRLLITNGGQWQEELDIKFAFIKGIPTRNILSIQQVWPANSYNYTSILNNDHLEKRNLHTESDVKSMKVRVVTTGHGQEGEFIPRTHSLNINGGNTEFAWDVWKECADNPIYPQGGTWVYDRAGWCPGAPSDMQEFEIIPYVVPESTFSLDYGLNTASGSSNYLVNAQLVKYGEANFQYDAAIDDIVSPSDKVIHGRINPVCSNPVVKIRNNGKNEINTLTIKYGIEGKNTKTYTWDGNLDFLNSAIITLPNLPEDDWNESGNFIAFIDQVNNAPDEYQKNNELISKYTKVDNLEGEIIIYLKSNAASNETSWILKDDSGNTIKTSKSGLSVFTEYKDTLKDLKGCYKLQFIDSGEDGISWWANSDGAGSIRIKGENTGWIIFQPDFGKELTFNFTVGETTSTLENSDRNQAIISPNPVVNELNIELKGLFETTNIIIYNQLGMKMSSEKITNPDINSHLYIAEMSDYRSGIYFININNKNFNKVYKVIKF